MQLPVDSVPARDRDLVLPLFACIVHSSSAPIACADYGRRAQYVRTISRRDRSSERCRIDATWGPVSKAVGTFPAESPEREIRDEATLLLSTIDPIPIEQDGTIWHGPTEWFMDRVPESVVIVVRLIDHTTITTILRTLLLITRADPQRRTVEFCSTASLASVPWHDRRVRDHR